MADNLVSQDVLAQDERWEPLADTDVVMFVPATGAILATVKTNRYGIASFEDVVAGTEATPIVPAYRLRAGRNSGREREVGVQRIQLIPATVVVEEIEEVTGTGTFSLAWGGSE